MNITLIGMAGVGKSFIGRRLAKQLNYHFVDTDDLIEKQLGINIENAFSRYSEQEIMKIEQNVILNLNISDDMVISTGGSAIYYEKGMNYLKSKSVVVLLNDDFKNIKKRLAGNYNRIIGIKDKSLNQVYGERKPLYTSFADVVVNCKNKAVDSIVNDVITKACQP